MSCRRTAADGEQWRGFPLSSSSGAPLVDQEDPETPHIKEGQEEPWTNQEGEEPQHLEQPDIKFTLTAVTVKSEVDEEKPELTQLHQDQTGENGGGLVENKKQLGTQVLMDIYNKVLRTRLMTVKMIGCRPGNLSLV